MCQLVRYTKFNVDSVAQSKSTPFMNCNEVRMKDVFSEMEKNFLNINYVHMFYLLLARCDVTLLWSNLICTIKFLVQTQRSTHFQFQLAVKNLMQTTFLIQKFNHRV